MDTMPRYSIHGIPVELEDWPHHDPKTQLLPLTGSLTDRTLTFDWGGGKSGGNLANRSQKEERT
jgi:hypothetical protein